METETVMETDEMFEEFGEVEEAYHIYEEAKDIVKYYPYQKDFVLKILNTLNPDQEFNEKYLEES